ncbi:MAG TPA: hypothetical protein VML19_26560 [Verrucomicrobiae bacterium]|nr:hypothetical protein [Verrucomicrobiae bacterium]
MQAAFGSWSDGGAASHTITTTASSAVYTATYTNVKYYLTTGASPANMGTISPASGWYAAAAQVTLTATAAAGSSFSQFTGTASNNTNPWTVTLNGAMTETAQFVTAAPSLTISPTPSGTYGWQQVHQGVPMVYRCCLQRDTSGRCNSRPR